MPIESEPWVPVSVELELPAGYRAPIKRTLRPVYVDRLPPCNAICPAGNNIQAWLALAKQGLYEAAWRILVEENPFPAILGRVCYHPCEKGCNRAKLDEAVNINAVERFLGDEAIKHGWMPAMAVSTGKRISVVGAGPAGLSAAFHLACMGHEVTIFDDRELPGGMMRYGIPEYRLPRDILDAEIDRLKRMGVRFFQEFPIKSLQLLKEDEKCDAMFVATGAGVAKQIDIPTAHAHKIIDALQMLMNPGAIKLGRRVVVYGGGNTAIDAARTARRLGVEEVTIVYRRDRSRMPAHDFEVTEALEEGIKLKLLSTITAIGSEKITIEKMRLDDKGKPQPTGEFEEIDADTILLAVGQDADTLFIRCVEKMLFEADGSLLVDDQMMATPGVFAGGDMTTETRTVTHGVGNGKKAARCINAWVQGEKYVKINRTVAVDQNGVAMPPTREIASYKRLKPEYYQKAPRLDRNRLEPNIRADDFREVTGGFDEAAALCESARCMSCGNCFECNTCFEVCPEHAVIKLGPGARFEFDYEICKGCNHCAHECPCGAIKMVDEPT